MHAERAKITDVPSMHKLINHFAERDEMLARPLSEIYENIRDYFVVRNDGKVIGCAALHVNWSDLAEVRSADTRSGGRPARASRGRTGGTGRRTSS